MQAYWLTFTDGSHGCCEGQSGYDSKIIAEDITGKTVAGKEFKDFSAEILPYPAEPIIWQFNHPIHGSMPTFCISPETCKGHTSCPRSYACSE